jgi:hypothetical protein
MKLRGTIAIFSVMIGTMVTFAMVTPASARTAFGMPGNLTIVGGAYTNDTTPTFTWTSPNGATWYEIQIDDRGWVGLSNVHTYTAPRLADGWHGFYVRAHNNAGDTSVSASVIFEIDTRGPMVPAVKHTKATVGTATTFSVRPTGEAAPMYCALYVDGKDVGGMKKGASDFSKNVMFASKGDHAVFARCLDGDGNAESGPSISVAVAQRAGVAITISRNTVVKTSCDAVTSKNDRCHSVYFYGEDGKRHAFTSEAVYRSWYGSSYGNVLTISEVQMDAMPVGKNVTMRPGTSLVKFMGSSTVYAVERGGVLRPIVNEAIAKAIFGSRWSAMLVELPGSVKADYTIGAKIDDSSDYSKTRAYYSVENINENF